MNLKFYQLRKHLKNLCTDVSGTTMIEYALVGTLASIAIVGGATATGISVADKLDCLARYFQEDGGMCVGDTQSSTHNVVDGWASKLEVKAGDTYELILPDNLQYTVWNDARTWFNANDGQAGRDRGFGAIITEEPLTTRFIGHRATSDAVDYRDFDNFYSAENNKITITATKNGYLNVGIVDINGYDNWVTTDGGVNRTREIPVSLTRVR